MTKTDTGPSRQDEADPRQARAFRRLHLEGPLVLVNAWDAASAAVVASCGAKAIATTSGGLAWALGFCDGERVGLLEVLGAVTRIRAAVDLPVTVDLERGFGDTPAKVGDSVSNLVACGAAGVNIEDSTDSGLRTVEEQAERLAAARTAADRHPNSAFVNARTDTYLSGTLDGEEAYDQTVRRGRAYAQAGADGLFVPGIDDLDIIRRLRKDSSLPLNVMVQRGSPSVAELAAAGAARISVGTALAQVAYSAALRSATEALTSGSFDSLRSDLSYGDMNALFA